jgi:hypothetical protein
MPKLTGGSRLATIFSAPDDDRRVTLPVQLRLQGAYRDSAWGAIAELGRGFQGTTASAGLERRSPGSSCGRERAWSIVSSCQVPVSACAPDTRGSTSGRW